MKEKDWTWYISILNSVLIFTMLLYFTSMNEEQSEINDGFLNFSETQIEINKIIDSELMKISSEKPIVNETEIDCLG